MKEQRQSSKFLDDLAQFLYEETEGMTLEENIGELREAGIDVPRIRSNIEFLIRKKRGQERLAEAKKQRDLELRRLEAGPRSPGWADNVREKIRSLLGKLPPEAASIHYRKFEQANEEDLLSFLEDLENLDRLEGE